MKRSPYPRSQISCSPSSDHSSYKLKPVFSPMIQPQNIDKQKTHQIFNPKCRELCALHQTLFLAHPPKTCLLHGCPFPNRLRPDFLQSKQQLWPTTPLLSTTAPPSRMWSFFYFFTEFHKAIKFAIVRLKWIFKGRLEYLLLIVSALFGTIF